MNAMLGTDGEADGGLSARGEKAGGIGTGIGRTLVGRRSTRIAVTARGRRTRGRRTWSRRTWGRRALGGRLARRRGADWTVLVERGWGGVLLVLQCARLGKESETLGGGGRGRVGQLVVVEDDTWGEHAAEGG